MSANRAVIRRVVAAVLVGTIATGTAHYYSKRQALSSRTASVTAGMAMAEPVNDRPAPGLIRQRPDFEKAIGILAEAANTNPKIADYYKDVAGRVRTQSVGANAVSDVPAPAAQPGIPDSAIQPTAGGSPQTEPSENPSSSSDSSARNRSVQGDLASNGEPSDAAATDGLTVGDLRVEMNPAIQRWVRYYTDTKVGRQTMNIGISRSTAYLDMAREEFRRNGVPEDLVWLAHVESVWNPLAISPAAAGGIWQFIPRTAEEYGLTVEQGDDERADPLKQTRAAAAYLHDLHELFGDWPLAIAAYNSGEPRVMDAVVRNGRADFWDLYDKQLLPRETRDYVPKILAAIDVASQANSYGFAISSGALAP